MVFALQEVEKAKKLVDSQEPKTVAICLVFRNERSIIEEFVAFHYLQGVGQFILFDDHSEDNVSHSGSHFPIGESGADRKRKRERERPVDTQNR